MQIARSKIKKTYHRNIAKDEQWLLWCEWKLNDIHIKNSAFVHFTFIDHFASNVNIQLTAKYFDCSV